jgi:hypothetical protein
MAPLQKKIRDLERIIKRSKNKDDIVNPELTEKLNALKNQKQAHQLALKEKKFSEKYHMVKFIERKKLTRSIRLIESAIRKANDSSSTDNLGSLLEQKQKLYNDLAYVLYYPKDMKYISILKDDDNNNNKIQMLKKRAKNLALEKWKNDISNGEIDKVKHAMDVEYNPTTKISSQKKIRTSESIDNVSGNITVDTNTFQEANNYNKNQKLVSNESSVQKSLSKAKRNTKKVEHDHSNEQSRSYDNNDSNITNDNNDDFFLEESYSTTMDNTTNDSTLSIINDSNKPLQLRPHKKINFKAINSKKYEQAGLTKQEIRLLKWQDKVRGSRQFKMNNLRNKS